MFLNRADVNWLGSWVVSFLQSLQNARRGQRNVLQRGHFQFLLREVREDIVYAYVHMDELSASQPYRCNPDASMTRTRKAACNYESSFHAKNIRLSQRFSKHMKSFGRDIGVYGDE